MTNYHLIKSGHREFFPYWDDEDLVSVGWNKAARQILEGASDDEVRTTIEDYYGQDPGYVLGVLNAFVGRDRGDRLPMRDGDIVIIIGQRHIRGKSVIRGVAEVGELDDFDEPIDEDFPHILYRDVTKWLYNGGPVVRKELSEKFQYREQSSTHLPSTLQRWNPTNETDIDQLVQELHDAPTIEPKTYDFDYDEKVIQAHIKDHPEKFRASADMVSDTLKKEYHTEAGEFADFVFLSNEEGATVVETKVGTAGPSAVRQLKRYLADIETNTGQDVRGIVVAEDFVDYEGIQSEIGDADISLQRYHVTLEYDSVTLK